MRKFGKQTSVLALVLFIVTTLLAGVIGTLLGGGFTANDTLNAPPLSPPAWLFAPVWTILYITMGIAAYLVWRNGDTNREFTLKLYFIQLIVNVLWTFFYFNLEWRLFSFFWILLLIALVALTIAAFRFQSRTAATLLIPYLVWLFFAAYLNLGYYVLNK